MILFFPVHTDWIAYVIRDRGIVSTPRYFERWKKVRCSNQSNVLIWSGCRRNKNALKRNWKMRGSTILTIVILFSKPIVRKESGRSMSGCGWKKVFQIRLKEYTK